MEGYGFLSILPAIIAISAAMITKNVLVSLFLGVSFGILAMANFNPMVAFLDFFEVIVEVLGDGEWNVRILLIVIFLGGLIGLLTKSGGSKAFAELIGRKVKSRVTALAATWIMGIIVFFDDFFNSLTIGAVMRPVTDQFKISREKLAYILDSTAAPVCILAPVSSWVAYCVSIIAASFKIEGINESAFGAFLKSIPYNFYAILAIIMVAMIIFTKIEYGPMVAAEIRAQKTGKVYDASSGGASDDDFKDMEIAEGGKVSDMVIPVIVLFVASIVFMLYTGGFFEGGKTLAQAFFDTDSSNSLIYGIFLSCMVAIIIYAVRKTVNVFESVSAMVVGMKSMFFAMTFMTLAWAIGIVSSEMGTGAYLVGLVGDSISPRLIPVIIFFFACFTAFTTGSSWGTYAIMLPIGISLAVAADANMSASIAATLGGGVFGDHCSPLADTTILSSAGAGVNHLDHVNTQLPYAFTVGIVALLSFLLAGVFNGYLIPLATGLVVLFASVKMITKIYSKKIPSIEKRILEENSEISLKQG